MSSRSWPDLVSFYGSLAERAPQFEPMADLVDRLSLDAAGRELERNTSMHTLLLSNAPADDWLENVLRVAYLPEKLEFAFEYCHYAGDTKRVTHRCSVLEGWETLCQILRYKFGTHLQEADLVEPLP